MKKRLGNKGFSLLELLVGITMLAIIVVPILHAFLTSAKTTAKAAEVRNQTVAALNVLESYEASDIDALISSINIDGDMAPFRNIAISSTLYAYNTVTHEYDQVTADSGETGDGSSYKVYLTNVAANDKTYDAVLNISTSKYSAQNSAGIVDYKPMDAVYIQPESADEGNPDVIAAKDFASRGKIDSGLDVDYHQFLDASNPMNKKTAITITGQADSISCTVKFTYAVSKVIAADTGVSPESSPEPSPSAPPAPVMVEIPVSYSTEIDVPIGSAADGENGDYGLYFFFYPYNTNDTIEIFNTDNIDMSIYLIRQTADIGTYVPVMRLKEKNDPSTASPHAKMYYNKDQSSYQYHLGFPNSSGGFNFFWFRTFTFDGNLVGTPAQNRLYGISVELYKAGSGFSGQPLATFDASSLE